MTDTIFALSTYPAKAGIAVVRISGERVLDALHYLGISIALEPRMATLCEIYINSEKDLIDRGLVLFFKGPNSFTGEDVVELHLHGGMGIIDAVIKALSDIECLRLAEPGEFSKRSFLNGKMNLVEAEGIADLIDSETEMQVKQAANQMKGVHSDVYENLRKALISIIARVEAVIDFPDEDLPSELIEEIAGKANDIKNKIKRRLNDGRVGEIIRGGVKIAIIGAPNCGKSTLLNCLSKRDVAIVSDIAGTTRDVIEVRLNLSGYPAILQDTAGIRESEDSIEVEGIKRAKYAIEEADLLLIMFDYQTDRKELNDEIKRFIDDKKSVCVYSKCDEMNDYKNLNCNGLSLLPISVHNNFGINELLNEIECRIQGVIGNTANPVITRNRHRIALRDADMHLEKFDIRNLGDVPELCAEDMRLAANALGRIIGSIDVEEVLNELFGSFCIGK